MNIRDLLKAKREAILAVAAKHGARNVRIFGSVARGEADEQSDIDFLVDVGPLHSPFFPGGLAIDLEELLGREVDIVVEGGESPYLRARIHAEAIPV
ncbi:MAG: nucleotidyltransferase family protein [Planctomycetota bacterium]|nr:nucleotidyltransferase family protein [Planctomycetota bacterium]